MKNEDRFVIGIGCRRGVSEQDIAEKIDGLLQSAGIDERHVETMASCTVKEDEDGLLRFARRKGWDIYFYAPDELNRVIVPNPSEKVMENVGTTSVCEAAAILASGGELVVPKQKLGNLTLAVAKTET